MVVLVTIHLNEIENAIELKKLHGFDTKVSFLFHYKYLKTFLNSDLYQLGSVDVP